MLARTLVIVALTASLLAACGRRGSLEDPGTTAPPPLDAGLVLDDPSPGAQDPDEPVPGASAPDRPFILDFLL